MEEAEQMAAVFDRRGPNGGASINGVIYGTIAAALRSLAAERDMWRGENIKKQTACEQMGARIQIFEAENARLRGALHKARAKYVELNDKDAAEAMAEIITEALGDDK